MYMNDWEESKEDGMISDFQIDKSALDGVKIILANYTYEDYEGDAFVLFEKEGKLYEVNAGHCSCYGLEGQWEPEETSKEAILARTWYSWGDGFVRVIRGALSDY